MDEADTAFKNNPELRAVVNSGWTRGAGVPRCNPDTHEPEFFETFGPKAIGLKGLMVLETTLSLSINIEVRQVLGAIAQFEKASSVAKLAAARKRKREREGRCEGRKPLSETRPEVVALARKLRRRRPKGGQLSLREVSKELAARGYLNERGKPYAAKSVASMLR